MSTSNGELTRVAEAAAKRISFALRHGNAPAPELSDFATVAEAYIAELSTDPITPELLRELGFRFHQQDRCDWYTHNDPDVLVSLIDGKWKACIRNDDFADTAGKLRTLLRLSRLTQAAAEAGKE